MPSDSESSLKVARAGAWRASFRPLFFDNASRSGDGWMSSGLFQCDQRIDSTGAPGRDPCRHDGNGRQDGDRRGQSRRLAGADAEQKSGKNTATRRRIDYAWNRAQTLLTLTNRSSALRLVQSLRVRHDLERQQILRAKSQPHALNVCKRLNQQGRACQQDDGDAELAGGQEASGASMTSANHSLIDSRVAEAERRRPRNNQRRDECKRQKRYQPIAPEASKILASIGTPRSVSPIRVVAGPVNATTTSIATRPTTHPAVPPAAASRIPSVTSC